MLPYVMWRVLQGTAVVIGVLLLLFVIIHDAAACVAPVPAAAKLFAEPGSAPVRMFGQKPLHLPDVPGAQFPSLYHNDACHGSPGTA